MKLGELLSAVGVSVDSNVEITGICNDSRQVRPGDLFCAVTGDGNDGLRYLSAAIEAGAAALAIDPAVQNAPADLPLADASGVHIPANFPVVEIASLNRGNNGLALFPCARIRVFGQNAAVQLGFGDFALLG